MKNTPRFSLLRAVGVAVLFAAWLTVSNHCALAVLGRGATAAKITDLHKCCAGRAPAQQDAPTAPAGMCCKSLRVLPADAPLKLVRAQENVLPFELAWTALSEAPAVSRVVPQTVRRMRPPRAESFAELVLQRSLLSHAPPLAA